VSDNEERVGPRLTRVGEIRGRLAVLKSEITPLAREAEYIISQIESRALELQAKEGRGELTRAEFGAYKRWSTSKKARRDELLARIKPLYAEHQALKDELGRLES
jgi:chromosome segregation ATPase